MKNKFKSLLSMTLALMMIISAMSFATVSAAVPEAPNAAALDTESVGLLKHTNTKGTYGVTNTFAHSGEHSLYVDSTTGKVGLGSCGDDFQMKEHTAYGFKFSMYILDYIDGILQIKPQNGHNGKTRAVYYTTMKGTSKSGISITQNGDRWTVVDEGNGWYTFKSKYPIYVDRPEDSDGKGTPAFLPGELFYFDGKFKAFIDDVEIYDWTGPCPSNTATENGFGELLAKRDFEPVAAPEPVVPEEPDAADLDTNVGLYKNTSTTGTYGVTNTFAHSGEHSLYVDSTEGIVGLGSCGDDFLMKEYTAYGFKFSMYILENTDGILQIKPQNARNGKTKAVYYTPMKGTSKSGISITQNGDRWTVVDEGNGWYTFKSKYPIYVDRPEDSDGKGTPAFLPGELFYFDGKFKAFIDDVEIYDWTADYTTNNATENGFGELLAKRDFEPAAAPEPVVPEAPNASELDTKSVGLLKHTNTKGTYGVTNTFAHSGEHSLYVDSTTGKVGLGSCADDFQMKEQTAYGFKFSMYILENTDGLLQIKPHNGSNGKTKAVYYTPMKGTSETGISITQNGDRWTVVDEGNGWYTFKSKYPIYVDRPEDRDPDKSELPAFLPGELFYFDGKFKAFIDDVEIYSWTADYTTNKPTENGFGELLAKRDFEPTGDYISDFNVSASGNTVTVSVDIRNCTKDNYTAQLFLVVYDGDTLDFVEMTEKTAIAKSLDKSATPTKLEKSVTIPAGKTMKMYLWDSLEGMTPLKSCKLYE